jgi:amino acid transporter
MTDFYAILGGALYGFLILALCMPALILYHYAYHYQGSKNIYLMRRLPNRWELHKRCVTLPLLAALICLLSVLVLLCIYLGIYMTATPRECLTPGQWQKIWSVLL